MGESPDAQSLLADIISEAKLANAIVVEMLEFVRPTRLQVERIDMADVLRQAVTRAESKAVRGGVRVTFDIAGELPPIHGDPYQLCQVFTNLLTNAFEALDGRGNISVVVIAEAVERVQLVEGPARMIDMMLLSGAKTWRFTPAFKDGEPVRYRTVISWAVQQ